MSQSYALTVESSSSMASLSSSATSRSLHGCYHSLTASPSSPAPLETLLDGSLQTSPVVLPSSPVLSHTSNDDRQSSPVLSVSSSVYSPSSHASSSSDEVTYRVLHAISQREADKLFDNRGFMYTINKIRGDIKYWRCSVRNKSINCSVFVKQRGDNFECKNKHIHAPVIGCEKVAVISNEVKHKAVDDLFLSASTIVEKVLISELTSAPLPSLPSASELARTANRKRETLRPTNPTEINFNLDETFIPAGFLQKDISTRHGRSILFASEAMLHTLCKSKTWYMDGTFKLVSRPFQQLYSVHAFIKSGDCIKQIPLVFCFMSRRRQKDYDAVLQALLQSLPRLPMVTEFIMDFEQAAWNSVSKIFPHATIRGCAFHWSQAVWRKIQSLGLQVDYRNDATIYQICRRIMALPLLPAADIRPQFHRLQRHANTPQLQQLFKYVEDNWIQSVLWPPESWSVFQSVIRTNNDVEGWHQRLNRKAGQKCKLPFYVLLSLLYTEAEYISIQMRLVNQEKLKKYQRKKYKRVQGALTKLWEERENGTRSARRLLKAVSFIYGPMQ